MDRILQVKLTPSRVKKHLFLKVQKRKKALKIKMICLFVYILYFKFIKSLHFLKVITEKVDI